MKSSIDLSQVIRLAIIGQPGLFNNTTGIAIAAYEIPRGELFLRVTKYYKSNTQRTYGGKTIPSSLSNLSFVQKLFRYGYVKMKGRNMDVWVANPTEHQLMEAWLQFHELRQEFNF